MKKQLLTCALGLIFVSSLRAQEPDQFGALAPANIAKNRPKAAFDLTGTWFVDLSGGFDTWRSGPPYPKFKGEAAKAFVESEQAKKEGKEYLTTLGELAAFFKAREDPPPGDPPPPA